MLDYDAIDRRIGETIDKVAPGGDSIEVDGFAFDGQNAVLDFVAHSLTDATQLSQRNLYGDAVDQVFAQEDVDTLTGQSTAVLWPLTDNQGSVRDIVSTDGTEGAVNEVQQVKFAGVPVAGTWTITTVAGTTSALAYNASLATIQAALDATTPHAGDIVVSGDYTDGFTLTYSGVSYWGANVSQATVDDSALRIAPSDMPTVSEETAGVAANDEGWQFVFDAAIGTLAIFGHGSSVGVTADGTLTTAALRTALESLYGSGNISVTRTSGDDTTGYYYVEFVEELADMPIAEPPSLGTSGLTEGSASLSKITSGSAGVQEVQTITLPAGTDGGTWSVNGYSLAYNAAVSDVQAVLGSGVTVSGGSGTFTVTWNSVGPQSLLTVGTALQFPIISEETAGTNPSGDGVYEVQSIGVPADANGGYWYLNGVELAYNAGASDLQTALGSGVTVTGSSGSFSVTWNSVGPQSLLSADFSSLSYPGGSVSEVTAGDDSTQEVQSVGLPSGVTGGYWFLNGSELAYNASASDVQSALGSSVTVSGGSGAFTVTWNDVGSQSLLSIDTSGLTFPGGGVTEVTAGAYPSYAGTVEVQTVTFPAGVAGGNWTLAGYSFAYNVTPATMTTDLDSFAGLDVFVSGSVGNYTVTWLVVGPQSLLSVDTSGLSLSSTIAENTAGAAANDETWSFSFDHPTGTYVIFGNSMSYAGHADGTLDATTLQTALEIIYGEDNVTVTLTSGDETAGTYTIEFVEGLGNQAIADPPSLNTTGLTAGSASFTNLVAGFAGVHEVQVITLPSNLVAGTWSVNSGSALAYNASAATVASYLDTLLDQTVTVTGSAGGPYTVTWTDVGPQSLLTVASIDLQITDHVTASTLQDGKSGVGLVAHFIYDSWGKVISVTDGAGVEIANPGAITNVTWDGYTYDWHTVEYVTPNRYYDPIKREWTEVDPIGFASGQTNLDVYAGNDPINFVDSTGMEGMPIGHHIIPQQFWRDIVPKAVQEVFDGLGARITNEFYNFHNGRFQGGISHFEYSKAVGEKLDAFIKKLDKKSVSELTEAEAKQFVQQIKRAGATTTIGKFNAAVTEAAEAALKSGKAAAAAALAKGIPKGKGVTLRSVTPVDGLLLDVIFTGLRAWMNGKSWGEQADDDYHETQWIMPGMINPEYRDPNDPFGMHGPMA